MKIFSAISFIIFLSISIPLRAQDCSGISDNFGSYQQAKEVILSTNFSFKDKCDTSKSSWILGAEFYMCDNHKGYFFLKTRKRIYIHKGLPLKMWYKFKQAKSFGRFYNSNIKGKYQLIIYR